jgi:predicted nuclease of predicted toxin-antitoxin system
MRFLVDECTGPAVASWLRDQNHDVFSVFDEARGLDDEEIIRKALNESWVLITNDKGFGDKIYRDGRLHKGVILLRLEDERPTTKIRVLTRLLETYSNRIIDSFLVATERQVRFAKK